MPVLAERRGLRARLALLFCLACSLACAGSGQPLDVVDLAPAAALEAPWTHLSLPIGEGKVVHCDPRVLTVFYRGDRGEAALAVFSATLQAKGWKKDIEVGGGTQPRSVTFLQPPERIVLTASVAREVTTLHLVRSEPQQPAP